MEDNRLKVNAVESKFMVLRGARKKFDASLVTEKVELNGEPLLFVERSRLFGLELDCYLTFENHVSKIHRHAAYGIFTLKLLSKGLPHSAAMPLFNSYVSCHFDYC